MTFIFDGKAFAREKEEKLKRKVDRLKKKGVIPKLVSIIVGNDPASVLYVNLKKKAAKRIGCKLLVVSLKETISKSEIIAEINKYNANESVHGIMVQLPLPGNFSKKDRDEILNTIAKEKDVDGLRSDSSYLTPTVKSIIEVIRKGTAFINLKNYTLKVVVVGAKGFEGKKICKVLKEMGYEVDKVDKGTSDFRKKVKIADIVISVTGCPGIIGADDIKEGSMVIDVGSPKGDVRTEEVLGKAVFISPVPGGIGPVTISCLLENLIEAITD